MVRGIPPKFNYQGTLTRSGLVMQQRTLTARSRTGARVDLQFSTNTQVAREHAQGRPKHTKHSVARGREGKTSVGVAMRGCGRTLHFSIAPSTKGWIQRRIKTKQQDYYVVFFDFIESSGAGGGT